MKLKKKLWIKNIEDNFFFKKIKLKKKSTIRINNEVGGEPILFFLVYSS